tara:strand:- start:5185 stop:5451 length:267 start_codon:yes stop_codon:yes gene_type:complete
MEIKKELKNATFIYDEEKKVFTIMDADGFNGYIELNKVYAFAFMRFVVRMAQRNWLRTKKSVDKVEDIMVELEDEQEDNPNQMNLFNE